TLDVLALEHRHLAPLRNQHFVVRAAVERIHAICRRDDQAALALGFLAEADGARNLRQDGRLFRFARFEEVGNTRQTTGDVAGLRTFLRDTRDNVTDLDLLAVIHVDDGLGGQEVMCRRIGTGQRDLLAFGVNQGDGRTQVLAGGRTSAGVGYRDAGQTGYFVGLALHAQAFFHRVVAHLAAHLGDDRVRMRIPVGHYLAGLDLRLVRTADHGAVRQ